MRKNLLCGAGRASITPEHDLVAHLKGLAGQKFCAVLDDLYIRAIAFDNGERRILMVSFELDKVPYPEQYTDLIERHTGIAREDIMLFAIHTHCAPVTGNRPDEGPNDRSKFSSDMLSATEQYERQLEEGLIRACTDAVNSLQPCRIGWETGESYIHVNRVQTYYEEQQDGSVKEVCGLGVNPAAKTDHTVFVLKAETFTGETIALFVNYAVHCCIMIGNDYDGKGAGVMTGDLGGRVSRMLEKRYGGVAVWSSGAAGDLNPLILNEFHYPDPANGTHVELTPHGFDYSYTALQLLSTRHMDDIVKVIRTIICREAGETELLTATGWSVTPGRIPGTMDPGEDYKIRLRMFRIGKLLFAGVSGELYSSVGSAIREGLLETDSSVILINHESSLLSNAGYIFDDETLARCGTDEKSGTLPGLHKSRITPGQVTKSLVELSGELIDCLR